VCGSGHGGVYSRLRVSPRPCCGDASATLNWTLGDHLEGAQPDVVFHAAYTSDAIFLMKTYKQQDSFPKLLIAHGSGFLDGAYRESLASSCNCWTGSSASCGRRSSLRPRWSGPRRAGASGG